MSSLANAAGILAACLCPPRCRSCRAPLFGHRNPYLCAGCLENIPWIGSGACGICGYPAGKYAAHRRPCRRCEGNRLNLTGGASVARYRYGARNLVLSLKFGGEIELVRPLAGLMAERLRAMAWWKSVDAVTSVPLHPSRRRARGFDQARLLAERLGAITGIPVRTDWLRRIVHTLPQASLRREARLENVTGAFAATKGMDGHAVLLVDDVMTTGATMAACALACRRAGARRVYAVTFAR